MDADLEEKFPQMCGETEPEAALMTEDVKSVLPLLGTLKSAEPRDKAMGEAMALRHPKSLGGDHLKKYESRYLMANGAEHLY